MTLHPCRNCGLSKGCEEKQRVMAIIRPAKLRTARFKCAKQDASLPFGSVALVDFHRVAQAEEDGALDVMITEQGITPEPKPASLAAIVMKRAKGTDQYWVFLPSQSAGCLVSIDRNDRDNLNQLHMARVFHKAIHPTGTVVPVCKHCGRPETATAAELGEWHCRIAMEERGDGYREAVELDCEFTTGAAV